MPRGNDAAAASRELAERYKTSGNAEDLVQAARLARSEVLARASLNSPDDQATRDLDLKKVASVAGVEEVLRAQVRGDYVTYVYEDARGAHQKGVVARKGTQAEKFAEEVDEREAGQVQWAQEQAAIAAAAREQEAKVEEARQEAAQKAQQEASQAVQKAQDDAAKSARK